MGGGEFDFLRGILPGLPQGRAVSIGPGDDCCGLKLDGRGLVLVTTDIRLDGVHFVLAECGAERAGRKALACSLSDCAAMAGEPVAAVVALALPRGGDGPGLADAFGVGRALLGGMAPLAEQFGCSLAGGDTTVWSGPLAVCVTCLAVEDGLCARRRDTAQVGEEVFVTGLLGGSLLGRHLDFTPRVREARVLAERLGDRLHGMLDLSDGLAGDLRHVAWGSGVAIELDEAGVLACASPEAHTLAGRDGRPVLEHVLCDGEDFEMVFTARGEVPGDVEGTAVRRIGRVVDGAAGELLLRRPGGAVERLSMHGFDHGGGAGPRIR